MYFYKYSLNIYRYNIFSLENKLNIHFYIQEKSCLNVIKAASTYPTAYLLNLIHKSDKSEKSFFSFLFGNWNFFAVKYDGNTL